MSCSASTLVLYRLFKTILASYTLSHKTNSESQAGSTEEKEKPKRGVILSLKNPHLKRDTKGPRRTEGMDVNLPTGYSQPFYLWKRPEITELSENIKNKSINHPHTAPHRCTSNQSDPRHKPQPGWGTRGRRAAPEGTVPCRYPLSRAQDLLSFLFRAQDPLSHTP